MVLFNDSLSPQLGNRIFLLVAIPLMLFYTIS